MKLALALLLLLATMQLYGADFRFDVRHERALKDHPGTLTIDDTGISYQQVLTEKQQKKRAKKPPNPVLNADALTEWLAGRLRMDFYHIDPLKIELKSVTQVMSSDYAQRRGWTLLAEEESRRWYASVGPSVATGTTVKVESAYLKARTSHTGVIIPFSETTYLASGALRGQSISYASDRYTVALLSPGGRLIRSRTFKEELTIDRFRDAEETLRRWVAEARA